MQAAGITLIRQVFNWAQIEQTPGQYSFAAYDQFVADAAAHGIEVMPVFYNEPSYLSSRPKHSKNKLQNYPPKKPASIAGLATAAVAWYGPNGTFWKDNPTVPVVPIRVWQIWDEPNLNFFWGPKANASAYVSMLHAASSAIHAVDPGAEVVSAGMPQSSDGINLLTFVRQMLSHGGAKWMNTLAVNAYSPNAAGVLRLIEQVRGVLNSGGGSRVGLRVTEIGWSDVGPKSRYRAGKKGQSTQISTVIHDFGSHSGSLKLRGFVYFDWRDSPPYKGVKDFWGLHTGLLNQNGTPKPSLAAFTKAVTAL
jgi:hypothetical protein